MTMNQAKQPLDKRTTPAAGRPKGEALHLKTLTEVSGEEEQDNHRHNRYSKNERRLVKSVQQVGRKDKKDFYERIGLLEQMTKKLLEDSNNLNKKLEQACEAVDFSATKAISTITLDQIPRDFFEKPMIRELTQKWKDKKYSHSNKEKFAEMIQKYKYVQKVINKVLDKELYDRKQLNRIEEKKFNQLRSQFTWSLTLTQQNTLQDPKRQPKDPKARRKMIIKEHSRDSFSVESKSDTLHGIDNFLQRDYTHFEESEKQLSRIRNRIDKVYLEFAKTEKYAALYRLKKKELAQDNRFFHLELRNMRRKDRVEDFFLDGSEMDLLPQGVLFSPLVKYRQVYQNLSSHK